MGVTITAYLLVYEVGNLANVWQQTEQNLKDFFNNSKPKNYAKQELYGMCSLICLCTVTKHSYTREPDVKFTLLPTT